MASVIVVDCGAISASCEPAIFPAPSAHCTGMLDSRPCTVTMFLSTPPKKYI